MSLCDYCGDSVHTPTTAWVPVKLQADDGLDAEPLVLCGMCWAEWEAIQYPVFRSQTRLSHLYMRYVGIARRKRELQKQVVVIKD